MFFLFNILIIVEIFYFRLFESVARSCMVQKQVLSTQSTQEPELPE